jgi:hypothetical protein
MTGRHLALAERTVQHARTTAAGVIARRAEHKGHSGGRYWARTSDLTDVNRAL